MFKKAVNKYFSWSFLKRVLILSIVLGIVVGFWGLFELGEIQIWLPKQEVYSYFDQLATDIVKLKRTDFLSHLDDLEYLKNLEGLNHLEISEIYENSNILNYYIVTENSKENTITIILNGYHYAKLTLIVSRDYKLISLDKFCNHTLMPWFYGLPTIFIYYITGVLLSFILNLVFIVLKKIAEYCSRIRKYFSGLRKNKKAKFEPEEPEEAKAKAEKSEELEEAETTLDAELKPESETETSLDADSNVISEDLPNGQHDQDEEPEESGEDDDYSASNYEF